jgi:hypothetical protein
MDCFRGSEIGWTGLSKDTFQLWTVSKFLKVQVVVFERGQLFFLFLNLCHHELLCLNCNRLKRNIPFRNMRFMT